MFQNYTRKSIYPALLLVYSTICTVNKSTSRKVRDLKSRKPLLEKKQVLKTSAGLSIFVSNSKRTCPYSYECTGESRGYRYS